MTAIVHVIVAPAGVDPLSVADRFDRDRGWATILTAPGAATAADLNRSLVESVTDVRTGGLLPQTESVTLDRWAAAWAAGWGTTKVAVFGAATATNHQKARLHQWAANRNVHVYLPVDQQDANSLKGRLHNNDTIAWDDFTADLPDPCQPPALNDPYVAATTDTYDTYRALQPGTAGVPQTDWPTYLNTCRRLLPPDYYRTIWWDYAAALKRAKATPPTREAVIALLDDLLLNATHADQIFTRVRATQAGAFTNDAIITLNMERLLTTVYRVITPAYTDAHWRSLRRFHLPTQATACALYMHGLQPDDLAAITTLNIESALSTNLIRDTLLDPRALPYLRALHQYHQHKSTHATGTAISGNTKHINGWLNEGRRLHGLPFGTGHQLPAATGIAGIADYIQLRVKDMRNRRTSKQATA